MFNPKYTISNRLLANIKKISEIVSILNNQRFSDVVLMKLENKAREVSSFSSTSIEGNPLPMTDVRRIIKNKPENIRDSEKEILNYNKVLLELNNWTGEVKQVFDLPLILKIQKIVTQDLIEEYRCGKLRKEPVFVNNPKTRQVDYLPPEHKEVSVLMEDLLDFTLRNENKIDVLILAGIFHKQLVVIHPFVDGNGRTARLAVKALLAKMGLNTFNLFSFENYYNKNVSKYFQEVGLFGNYYELKNTLDFTTWLEYFTDGIIDELLRVQKLLQSENASPKESLQDYHQEIITYIKENDYIADRDYAKLTTRAKPTRHLDFKKLISMGIIEKRGKGKATYYKFKNTSDILI